MTQVAQDEGLADEEGLGKGGGKVEGTWKVPMAAPNRAGSGGVALNT